MRNQTYFSFEIRQSSLALLLLLMLIPYLPLQARKEKAATPVPSTEVSQKFSNFFLEAIRQKEKGKDDAAYELLNHALTLRPDASEVLYELAQLNEQHFSDSVTTTRQLLERAEALDPSNRYIKSALADFYSRHDLSDESIRQYEEMSHILTDNNRSEVLLTLCSLYEGKGDFDSAIKTLDRLEQNDGKSEIITMNKVRLFLQMHERDKALKEVEGLRASYPNDTRYAVIQGDLFMQEGDTAKGLDIYHRILAEEPQNSYAQLSMLDYYHTTGKDSLYRATVEAIALNPLQDNETRIGVMRNFIQASEEGNRDSSEVLKLFHRILAQPQTDRTIGEMCQMYMALKQMPADSILPIVRQELEIEPDYKEGRMMLLQVALKKVDLKRALSICQEGIKYNPDEPVFYYYKGVCLFQDRHTAEALASFSEASMRLDGKTDADLASGVYAFMGDAFHELNKKEEAYAAYDSSLVYKDDNVLCLNNYAYFLSLDRQQLDKAEEMSFRTIKIEPENATYLDTYAWILFVKGEYAKAKIYIDETMKHLDEKENNVGIIEHAGDIYAKNGLIPQAVEFWTKALKEGGETRILKKKIQQKKYIAQ